MLLRFDLFLENFKIRLKTEEDKDAVLNLYYNNNSKEQIFIETDSFLLMSGVTGEQKENFLKIRKTFIIKNFFEQQSHSLSLAIANTNNYNSPEGNIFFKQHSVYFILDKHNQYPQLLNLSDMVDEFDISGQKDTVLAAVQLVDASIEDLRTFNKKRDVLYAKQNGVYRPLQYFGDALQKIILYILAIKYLDKIKT